MLEYWNGSPPDDQEDEANNAKKIEINDQDTAIDKTLEAKEKEYAPFLKENAEIEKDISSESSGMAWM